MGTETRGDIEEGKRRRMRRMRRREERRKDNWRVSRKIWSQVGRDKTSGKSKEEQGSNRRRSSVSRLGWMRIGECER
jgi:ferric-dicitrate binding protein FerR (iron transport regulator)